jgi:RNA polymerase sigma-70 factor (ECF subfamily)
LIWWKKEFVGFDSFGAVFWAKGSAEGSEEKSFEIEAGGFGWMGCRVCGVRIFPWHASFSPMTFSDGSSGPGLFLTTHWSMVQGLQSDPVSAEKALAELCRTYWYPMYAFARRQGYAAHDAEDVVQGFFARLLEKRDFGVLAREKGRFRSFLLAAAKHFFANERDRSRALKRGGGREWVSIDVLEAENRYAREPADGLTPQADFDRQWALSLLERVLERLRGEMVVAGRGGHFEAMKFVLTGGHGRSYVEVGRKLGMSEGAVKVAVHRLRERYRDLIRAEVAQTVSSEAELEEELRALLAALG